MSEVIGESNLTLILDLSKMSSRLPLVVILGATGTGKTKLSIDIARKYAGEIISADSMQVYRDLNIITAKATREEQAMAPHHLLDVVDPLNNYSVVDFQKSALKIIDDLLLENKMPVVVGGTNYYIESLLWNILIKSSNSKLPKRPISPIWEETRKSYSDLSNNELHHKLQAVDPQMAQRLHPNNRRKILRALEVAVQEGRRMSEILDEQHREKGGGTLGGSLRYSNALILWLTCDQTVLDERLNARVDKMMEMGLLEELTEFHRRYNEQRLIDNRPPDYTTGLFQSIGFKEFHNYLILNSDQRDTEKGQELLKEGLDSLKIATRRYARKQLRWIRNRFLGNPEREIPKIYSLDTSQPENWTKSVLEPAVNIIDSYLEGRSTIIKELEISDRLQGEPSSGTTTNFCEICQRRFVGALQWSIHLKSGKHLRAKKKREKTNQEITTTLTKS